MSLARGTRLGPYEILSSLGAGGMGEVYRARDTRLGREVALKVMRPEIAENPGARSRFEQEARAAGALSHPTIVSIHDVGYEAGVSFIVSELIEGENLRQEIERGPVALRRLLDLSLQMADGLAAAHAAGIVHRDLKPENIMITREGRVKILDFGIAKQNALAASEAAATMTQRPNTQSGMLVGTTSYMSPEQARGAAVDYRSDQFAFGLVLYEMATGKQPFRRDTGVETLSAILKEEPPPLDASVPAPLRWISERCLSKLSDERYASTKDLYRDLRDLRDHLSDVSGVSIRPGGGGGPVRRWWLVAAVALAAILLTAGIWAARTFRRAPSPEIQALTFRRGTVNSARFAPDGRTVIYGASWGGEPVQIYTTRPGSPESTALGLEKATVLSVSSSGELAVSQGYHFIGGFLSAGMLARMPQSGGAPREVLDDVQWADWAPDGSGFAVVRDVDGKSRLEYPIGKILYQTAGWISHPRVSRRGDRIAFLDHPARADDGGSVAVIDLQGARKTLAEGWISEWGLAWAPVGDEVWFTAAAAGNNRALHAVTMSGERRVLFRAPGILTLHDVSATGRVLVSRDTSRIGIAGLSSGETRERDLSWLDWSLLRDLSADGKTILFDETGEGAGSTYAVYIRKTDGSPAVRLGEGSAMGLSPDGKWAIAIPHKPQRVTLLPTGPGEAKAVALPGNLYPHAATWFPDGRRMLLLANEPGHGVRLHVVVLDSNLAVSRVSPIGPEGLGAGQWNAITPDQKIIAAVDTNRRVWLINVDGGAPRPAQGTEPADLPMGWTADGRYLYLFARPARSIYRWEMQTGHRQLFREISPPDRTGLVSMISMRVTPDGKSYAYSMFTTSSELYLMDGLR
jgi:hypothetical protein